MRHPSCLPGLLLSFMLTACPRVAAAEPRVEIGPLAPVPALTFYLIATGSSASAELQINRGARLEGDRLMIRAFDPDERLTFWQYLEPGQMTEEYNPGDSELQGALLPAVRPPVRPDPTIPPPDTGAIGVWGLPVQNPIGPAAGDLFFDATLPLAGAGIHQLRITSGANNSRARLRLPAGMDYGVSFQNGTFSAWPGQPATLYVYVPPRAEELRIVGGPLRIVDERNRELFHSTDRDLQESKIATIAFTAADRDKILRVEFAEPGHWQFRAAGFPFILCTTREAAAAIRASVEVLPDGTVVTHKFQRRIAELLPRLLAPENVGRAEELLVPLSTRREAWLKNPERNSILVHPYGLFGSLESVLKSQNVDPQSHWGGSISGWQERIDLPSPENRWDRLKSTESTPELKGLWAGASRNNGAAALHLALAALLDDPINPYFGKKELLNRAAAAALRDLMTLGEDETWRGIGADLSAYPGMMSFPVGQKTFPVYALAAPQMPAEIREVWTEGLRHIVDRGFPEGLVSCRNQSSHFLTAYEEFARGSGDPRYQNLSRVYARRFAAGASPGGYHREEGGPDGSYIGMTHWHMAVYYQHTHDPVMLEALRKSYTFFNHTVAPEPGGSMLGGFNFNHRVGAGFYAEQFGGARGILQARLPEVGLWADPERTPIPLPELARALDERISAPIEMASGPGRPYQGDWADWKGALKSLTPWVTDLANPRYFAWGEPDRTGTWPALEPKAFVRDLSGQLIAIRRPGYYAVVYVGHPAASPHYIASREQFRRPYPDDAENRGGSPAVRKVTPYLGGGLSLFWTPAYGSSLLATNWSPLTHHGLVATQDQGLRYWENYFDTRYSLDEKAGTLTLTGTIEQTPLRYERRYRMHDDALEIELTVEATAPCQLTRLVENIPLAAGAVKSGGVKIHQTADSSLYIQDAAGQGVQIAFEGTPEITLQRNGLQVGDLQIARAEVNLPAHWGKGRKAVLRYSLRPLK